MPALLFELFLSIMVLQTMSQNISNMNAFDTGAVPRQLKHTEDDDFNLIKPSRCPTSHILSKSAFYFCPTPDKNNANNWPCIRNENLCNGISDCPNGEDEQNGMCMFYRMQKDEERALKISILEAKKSISHLRRKLRHQKHSGQKH